MEGEATLYEDSNYGAYTMNSMNQMKRNLSLDLNQPHGRQMVKKMRLNPGVASNSVLSSPDLNLLKLASPELEKMIMSNAGGVLNTPPGLFYNPQKKSTKEQDDFVSEFEDALMKVRNSDSNQSLIHQVELPASSSGSSTSGGHLTYTNLDQQVSYPVNVGLVQVKEEPQTVPSLGNTPPLSPIDMETQERIKLERKRQRNRVAASKCRRRKLERISKLEDKVKQLKNENSELSGVVAQLKSQVCQLKAQVMDHMEAGCQLMVPSLQY